MESTPEAEPEVDRLKRAKVLVVVLALVGSAAIAAAAQGSASPCQRQVVEGNLDGDAQFVARDVIVYASGMFPGNPVIVRLEGHVEASGWVSVRLPEVQALDQLRVVGNGPRVTGYFLEDGNLHFSVEVGDDAPAGAVVIYYVAGSASWSNHYELDLERSDLALIGKIQWGSKAMFRHVDMLFVSGKLHAVATGGYEYMPQPAPAAGGSMNDADWAFDVSTRVTSAPTANLATFSVPSSSDEGIYIVHRAADIDMPGSNGNGLKSCKPTAFYLRIHESPVEVKEVVVVTDAQIDAAAGGGAYGADPAMILEVRNIGDLPWMPGRADIYRTGIIAGADNIGYTARNGTVDVQMGSALDIEATRIVTNVGGRVYHNYTLRNLDVSNFTVEVQSAVVGTVGGYGPFVRDGSVLKARGVLQAGAEVQVSWWAT